MENEFPPNAHSKQPARRERPAPDKGTPDKKDVQRVTKSKAIQRKKPLRQKFVEAFRPDDGSGMVEHVVMEMLVPGIKDLIADTSATAIENALGVNGGSRSRSRRGGGYTSYSRMGAGRPDRDRDRGGRSRRDRDDDRGNRRGGASDHNQIILEDRVEANEVIDTMIELISKFDQVTVRDLLSLVGEPHTYTDEDWGWTDLRGARIHRVREGYLLDLPRPEYLD